MVINSLALHNFRNYENMTIEFSPHMNIIFGDNAQGKTNILEALYVGGTTKSHKGSKDKELIKIGQEEAHIKMMVEKDDICHKLDMHLKKNKSKGIAIDGIPLKRSGELFGLVHFVFFSPEDLNLIKEGPGERRKFMDMELSQLDKIYLHNLTKYSKVIIQRNNLLKQISFDNSLEQTLSIWDEQLVTYGTYIINSRQAFIADLNEIISPIHSKLTGNKENIKLIYEPNIKAEDFAKKLDQSRKHDLYQKTTLTGPHRDDISFIVDGCDIRKYGSQGQQRTAALSLKLAEIELVRKTKKEDPVLLLDDVLSELDRNRQNYLMDSISDIQTLITCTGLEEFVQKKKDICRVFKVTDGHITERNGELE